MVILVLSVPTAVLGYRVIQKNIFRRADRQVRDSIHAADLVYTGEIERGTSAYRYRWQNNQGDVLYVDENGYDPNRYEEYNSREWKRSEVWDRRK